MPLVGFIPGGVLPCTEYTNPTPLALRPSHHHPSSFPSSPVLLCTQQPPPVVITTSISPWQPCQPFQKNHYLLGEGTGSRPRTIWLWWGGGQAHPQAEGWGASPHPPILPQVLFPSTRCWTHACNELFPGRSLQHCLISHVSSLAPPRSLCTGPHPSLCLSHCGEDVGQMQKGPCSCPASSMNIHRAHP